MSNPNTPDHPHDADRAPEEPTMQLETDSTTWATTPPENEAPPEPTSAPVTAVGQAPAAARPTGPHLPPILLGLACLVVAGLALAQELGGLSVDWGDVGPLGIVGVGALLVVFGLVGLTLSRRRTDAGTRG